jgi:hypothetical protein
VVSELIGQISSLNESQLRQLNCAIIHELKHKRRRASVLARDRFSPGDRVGFGDRAARGKRRYKEGEIVRIKRTRAEVKVDHTTWTVPLNMLEAVGG